MPKLLYVEDEAINAFLVKKILQKDFDVEIAYNTLECLRLLEKNIYQIILIDINLGQSNFDGINLVQKVKTLPNGKDSKCIAVTAFALPADKQKFLDQGFDDYIAKPIEADILLNVTKKYA